MTGAGQQGELYGWLFFHTEMNFRYVRKDNKKCQSLSLEPLFLGCPLNFMPSDTSCSYNGQ